MVFDELIDKKSGKRIEGVYDVIPKKANKQSHTHPVLANKTTMVENVPKYVGSLGDINQEGCIEHADERFIMTDDHVENLKQHNKLAEYIVFSEILGKPKCKR